jgi:RHS repeat-associated protein
MIYWRKSIQLRFLLVTLGFLSQLACFLVLACLLLGAFAFGESATPLNSTAPTAAQTPAAGQPATQLDFQTDVFTGRFGYTVPMPLAPARHGSAPDVTLHYTSGGENGWCGVGWDLDLGFIERETRFGVPVLWQGTNASPSYDDAKGFVFSLNGKSSRMVKAGSVYRAEIEGGFLKFQFTAENTWVVTDKSGNQYFFGRNASTRVANPHWGTAATNTTFRWALDRIVTVNNDIATISYTTISNRLYPQQLAYNGHGTDINPLVTVDFNLTDRSDSKISARSGFMVTQNKRLDSIVHKVNGAFVWSCKLNYTNSPSTMRSLLTSVTRNGTDQTTPFPVISFSYQPQQFGFQQASKWGTINVPSGGVNTNYWNATGQRTDLADMDGDGLPDWVESPSAPSYANWFVQLNNGSGIGSAAQWPIGVQSDSSGNTTATLEWATPQSGRERLLDINGDGKADRVSDLLSYYTKGSSYDRFIVDLSGSTAFSASQTWTNVVDQGANIATYRAVETGSSVVMMDVNGDGLPDRVMTDARVGTVSVSYYKVQFNTGNGFTGVYSFGPFTAQGKSRYGEWAGLDTHVRLIDINGDGLPDRVMEPVKTNNTNSNEAADAANQTSFVVELNNGWGFEPEMRWPGLNPQYNLTYGGNLTSGFTGVADSEYMALRDVNGDGLPDRSTLIQNSPFNQWLVQLNTGYGFGPTNVWPGMDSQGQSSSKDYAGIFTSASLLVDLNGDGLPDRFSSTYNGGSLANYFTVQLSKGPFPDLMTTANNGVGGAVTINYTLSTQYNNRENTDGTGRQLLPFPQWTVSSITESDGINPVATTTYAYEGGMWGFDRREFNGFAKVTTVDPLSIKTVHYFHQAGGRDYSSLGEYNDNTNNFGKKGMEYRTDTYGSDGNRYKTVLNKVEEMVLDGVRHFGYVTNTISMDYKSPGGSDYRARAEQFFYNTNGDITKHIDYGEVTGVTLPMTASLPFSGTGAVYRRITYASLGNTSILDKPQQIVLASDSGFANVFRETLYEYDGTTGNPTKISRRICPNSYAVTRRSYDATGNLFTETSPSGVITSNLYEQTYKTFPVRQITGPLTTFFTYDARSGKLMGSIAPTGLATTNKYDALLRLTTALISPSANTSPTLGILTNWYSLGGIASDGTSQNYVRTSRNDDLGGHETWTYLDGLGRPIQTRVESETSGKFRVNDTAYNKRGAVVFTSLPYLASGTGNSAPQASVGTYNQFDPVGRVTSSTAAETPSYNGRAFTTATPASADTGSPVGSAQTAYYNGSDPWTLVKTDEAGSVVKYVLDGLGRTNQVIESNGGSIYTTTYTYDVADSLTKIHNNAGNDLSYAYNNLGQVVAMADPDMGVWLYARDVAGRITTQTDANGQKVVFHYETALGRVSSRDVYDFKNNLAYTVSYLYDSNQGDSGYTVYPGQLYKMTDKEGWEKHSYDYRGREVKTSRYLSRNSNTYTTQTGYDNMDRMTSTTYPNNGGTASVTYDSGANLSVVKHSTTNIYSANGFDDVGHLKGILFGNNISTSFDYYSNSKRLKNIATSGKQNLTYTYDKVSDVTAISDSINTSGAASATISASTYDGLHRLTGLTRPTGAVSFTYNSIGNLTANGEATNAAAYTYLTTRLPHAVITANGKNYAYDLNGNMLVRGNQHLEYDPENRLVLVRSTNATTTFGYSGDGERLWKQTSTTNGLQIWIGNIYEEKNGKTLYHIYAGSLLVCTFDASGTVVDYYQSDNLHSSSILTSGTGGTTQHYEYTAYGQDRYINSATAFPETRRFTSQAKDDETGLMYYGARYYDPELGRFIQPDNLIQDQFDPQSLNRYAYARNNPLRYIDPSGHLWYDSLASWAAGWINPVKGGVNSVAPRFIAGAINEKIDTGTQIFFMPSSIGHLGEATGRFSVNPNGENTMGVVQDVSVAVTVVGAGMAGLPSLKAPLATPVASESQEVVGAARIQKFADKYQTKVDLVGSRASGTASATSDYDYVIGGTSKVRQAARKELPRGTAGGEISPSGLQTGIDVFNAKKTPLDTSKPHITFEPKAKTISEE